MTDLFVLPDTTTGASKRTRTSVDAAAAGGYYNADSLFTQLRQWMNVQPASFSKYVRDLTVCPDHQTIVEVGYPGLKHIENCSFCWSNSGIQRAIEASDDIVACRTSWRSIITDIEDELVEAMWVDGPVRRTATIAERDRRDAEETRRWLAYTFAAWSISVERRRQVSAAKENKAPMPPLHNPLLQQYVQDTTERLSAKSLASERAYGGKMYCFAHDQLGDFVAHRHVSAYMDCGICLCDAVKRKSTPPNPLSSSSSTSSYSSAASSASSSASSSTSSTSSSSGDSAAAAAVVRVRTTRKYDNINEQTPMAATSLSVHPISEEACFASTENVLRERGYLQK
jgi:hypothetical protein